MKNKKEMDTVFQIRLPKKLLRDIFEYAKKNEVAVSEKVREYLTTLTEVKKS